jgi:hypothetical protein
MTFTLRDSEIYHPDYSEKISEWDLVKDVLAGKKTIDSKGTTYLPTPSGRTEAEYASYQLRAVLYNATSRTLDGLLGAVFRKDSKVVLPAGLQYLAHNTDGEGSSITQFSKKAVSNILAFGRHGLLVDYPQAQGIYTLEDERKAGLKARIQSYTPQSIVNWHTVRDGGLQKLVAVMIKEPNIVNSGHYFSAQESYVYRLLELDAEGFYQITILEPVEVFDKSKGIKTTSYNQKGEVIKPKLPNGKRLSFIPFVFVGSMSNTPEIDKAPLYDLAVLNLAHYRNSADYEEALFMIGQPTPWITGLSDKFIEDNQGSLRIGSRAGWMLPEGCEVGLLESKAEKNLLQKGMELKEVEMLGLGAKIVQDSSSSGSESTQNVLLRRSSEASQVSSISSNVTAAITQCLVWAALWMNEDPDDIQFELNRDFFSTRLSHQDVAALVSAWQGGAISHKILLDNFRRGEIVGELVTDEEVRNDIDEEEPALGFVGADQPEVI